MNEPESAPPSARRLMEILGPGVLRPVSTAPSVDAPIRDVVIYDPADPAPLRPGVILLAVGLSGGRPLADALARAGSEGAILVLKAAPSDEADIGALAARAGTSVLAIAPGAAWLQIGSLLRSALTAGYATGDGEAFGGVAAGDLFAVANAVSALVDAPVTIEDPQSRVLAFSARQDEADEARMATILGRQVPEEYARHLQETGVFRRLLREEEPIYLEDIIPGVLPRLAVAVRAGDEVLGSMWAAVRRRPTAARLREFAEAANFVAIHLLRHRLAADTQRGMQADLVAAVLGGGALAADAASRLGLSGAAYRVIAVGLRRGDAVDNEVVLLRIWDTLSIHLSVGSRRASCALVRGLVYAVLPVPAEPVGGRRQSLAAAEGFLTRLPPSVRREVLVGIGGHATELAGVPQSRRDADQVIRVLRDGVDGGEPSIAGIEEMRMQVLMLKLTELAAEDGIGIDGPLAALLEMDEKQNMSMVRTLRAYLDAFGDVAVAAARLGVHQNTLRYRLQKMRQVPGLDLAEPLQRLALELQLRMLDSP